jgi:hypothetical protein
MTKGCWFPGQLVISKKDLQTTRLDVFGEGSEYEPVVAHPKDSMMSNSRDNRDTLFIEVLQYFINL